MGKIVMSRIKELRQRKGLSQSGLARELEMTESTVRNWEHGRTGLEWFERVAKLCEVLECSPNELFGYEEVS
jgi:transcriptional regulator with XRE-family HTH domain